MCTLAPAGETSCKRLAHKMVVNFQESLANYFAHGQVHPQHAIEWDAEQF